MTLQPEELVAMQERADHAKAQARGQRIADLASFVIGVLVAEGLLPSEHRQVACVVIFPILADDIYGLAAVDIPQTGISKERPLAGRAVGHPEGDDLGDEQAAEDDG